MELALPNQMVSHVVSSQHSLNNDKNTHEFNNNNNNHDFMNLNLNLEKLKVLIGTDNGEIHIFNVQNLKKENILRGHGNKLGFFFVFFVVFLFVVFIFCEFVSLVFCWVYFFFLECLFYWCMCVFLCVK